MLANFRPNITELGDVIGEQSSGRILQLRHLLCEGTLAKLLDYEMFWPSIFAPLRYFRPYTS